MPSLKLTYFDGKGRAEPLRWIMAAGNLAHESETFGFDAWPAKKTTTPYGSVPVLTVDGKQLSQTVAIARYLGTVAGMTSQDPFKNAIGDEVVDTVAEMVSKFFGLAFEKDAEKKAADEKTFYDEYLPKIFSVWESRITTKFLVEDKPIWQDVFLGHWLSRIREVKPEVVEKFPKLTKLTAAVQEIEGLKKYLAAPPKYSIDL